MRAEARSVAPGARAADCRSTAAARRRSNTGRDHSSEARAVRSSCPWSGNLRIALRTVPRTAPTEAP
ncbi:hypothetical protein AC792_09610 [Arthrobacter sp. RIT-PI-e]|nr:hypothetical protein AC792_09610 [Arthrobacter sp. RIT-PI-e]